MTDQELDRQVLATLKRLQRARAEHAAHTARLREHEDQLAAVFSGGTLVQPSRRGNMGFSWDAARGVLTMYDGGSDASWPSVEDVAETVRALDAAAAEIDHLKAALKDMDVDPELFK